MSSALLEYQSDRNVPNEASRSQPGDNHFSSESIFMIQVHVEGSVPRELLFLFTPVVAHFHRRVLQLHCHPGCGP